MTTKHFKMAAASCLVLIIYSAILPCAVRAQSTTESPEFCSAAIAALTGGTTAADSVDGVWGCPNVAVPVNAAILSSRMITDSARLDVVFWVGGSIVDDRLAASALSIASDAAASELARAHALIMLLRQVNPVAMLPQLSSGGSTGLSAACLLGGVSTSHSVTGMPLSGTTRLNLFNTSTSLFRNAQVSARIRYLANCLWHQVRGQVSPTIQSSQIQLTYLCGNRFRVRNRNFAAARLTWDVYNTAERGDVIARGSYLVSPPHDQNFTTNARGTVRLFLNGQLIQTKANGGSTCSTAF